MKSKKFFALAIHLMTYKGSEIQYAESFTASRMTVYSRLSTTALKVSSSYDGQGYLGQLGTENKSQGPSESEVWKVYIAWCREFSKSPDQQRFMIFFDHYTQMESYARKNNVPLQLTEYADMTLDEYDSAVSNTKSQVTSTTYTKPQPTHDVTYERKSSGSFLDGVLDYVSHLEEVSTKMHPLETTAQKIRMKFQSKFEYAEERLDEIERIEKEKVAMREEERKKRHAQQEKDLAKQLADAEAAAIAKVRTVVIGLVSNFL